MKAFRRQGPFGEAAMIHGSSPLPGSVPLEPVRTETGPAETAGTEAAVPGQPVPASRSGLAGALTMVPAGLLGFTAAVDTLQDLARLRAWLDAQEAMVVDRITGIAETETYQPSTGTSPMAETVAATEIATALRIPERTALALMSEADLLVNTFPATRAALEAGTISRRHAITITDQASGIPHPNTAPFEAELLGLAPHLTCEKLKTRARRLRERHHPETLATRHRRAAGDRRIELHPDQDAMCWLGAYLPAEAAVAIHNRLTDAARSLQGPDETRTLTQLRADVFTGLLTLSYRTGPDGRITTEPGLTGASIAGACRAGAGITASAMVLVPALTLLGHDEEPAELEGYGPVPADTGRRLAAHAPSFTRLLTHPETGAVLSIGRTKYKVPADLRKWCRVRDRTCRFPGCNAPALRCDLDHTTPWAAGGPTDHQNLCSLCRKHHRTRHKTTWKPSQPDPGTITWTSPAGKTYTTTPDPPPRTVLPDWLTTLPDTPTQNTSAEPPPDTPTQNTSAEPPGEPPPPF
jgi:hypothetical protein